MTDASFAGRRLKLIRERLNITQQEFCKSLSISQPALSYIEKGTGFHVGVLIRLKLKYNVNVDWVLFGIGNMINSKEQKSELAKVLAQQEKELKEKMDSVRALTKQLNSLK